MFTENDIRILKYLLNRKDRNAGLTMANGKTINEIAESTGLSTKKVRQTIKTFIECGFAENGIKKGNAATYIITIRGLEELKNIRKNIINEEV